MKYDLIRPCDKCPFRNDITPFIHPERAEEIANAETFPCHKTTRFDDDGEVIWSNKEHACAGHLILREKMKQPTQMMRISERLGMYDYRKLDMTSPIYDSIGKMIKAHKNSAK